MYAYWLCTRERTGNIIDDVIAIFSDKWNTSRAGVRPSVRPSVDASVHIFKHEYLYSQRADHNGILSEALLG